MRVFAVAIVGAFFIEWRLHWLDGRSQLETGKGARVNIGFFHFDRYRELDRKFLSGAPVRVAITWDQFEPRSGVWKWDNKQAIQIDDLVENGHSVIPCIRSKSDWAVRLKADCGSAPKDMDVTSPLKEGVSYSETYYRFIHEIAKHFPELAIVCIENEINDPIPSGGDWGGTVDEYFRLVLTAKKAFHDINPRVRIADGGMQPQALYALTLNEYVEKGRLDEALTLYERMEGKETTEKKLRKEIKQAFGDPRVRRAADFINAGLYQWVDVANFHWQHRIEALPEVVEYLRRKLPLVDVLTVKSLMCNAYGATAKIASTPELAAREILTKTTRLLSLGVCPVLLMNEKGDRIATSLVDSKGNLNQENVAAFNQVCDYLGKVDPLTVIDESQNNICAYRFGNVGVNWRADGAGAVSFTRANP